MQIDRHELIKAFSDFALHGSGIVVGAPGIGKTFILKGYCTELIKRNLPCLYLPIDKLGVETEGALKVELGVKGDLITYLLNQEIPNKETKGILVIDAFDAARSEVAQKFFLSLIRRIIYQLQGVWNVIVSVRTYDARKSEDLQDLFPGSAGNLPSSEFQMADIHCRHFAIPKLTNNEVSATVETIPHLQAVYERGSVDFRELLRIPFNLWLLEKLLSIQPNIPELSSVSSEIQLLGLFWKQRVTEGHMGEDRQMLLMRVAQAMVTSRSLSVRIEEVYVVGANDAWDSLLSSEVLIKTSTAAQRAAFSHNILFDYAVSVLLIEDEPAKLTEFIAQDPSRPLFLRPSLTYYFTRLWYNNPDLFWKGFWDILPKTDIHLRLFARLLPTAVIANESRKPEELTPLLDLLSRKQPIANEAVLRLLQALRALEIQRDELWLQFIDKAAEHLNREFVWDAAVLASNILGRSGDRAENIALLQMCGQIGRKLLKWVWSQREKEKNGWVDTLGANWAIPLVAKTFEVSPEESRFLLGKVLDLTREEGFPINFLYRLTNELNKIWPHDPEFAASTYRAVFSYYETSEEQTNFGTPVLPLSSTRRQDYEMCQYHLIRHFPHFLRAAPHHASTAAIWCLNNFIVGRHIIGYLKEGVKLDDLLQEFKFRGKTARYMADSSYLWDESEYADEPIKMGDELFKFIGELSSTQSKLAELDSQLDIFRDSVLVAFFWRRLLETAAREPKIFADRLFELCIARPVQMGSETLHELGTFLEAAASEFTDTQLREIEQTIIALPEDDQNRDRHKYLKHRRDRLLACIPAHLLKGDKAKGIRRRMERTKSVPKNEPLVKFSSWSEPYTLEKRLKEEGVDIERPQNQEIYKYFAPLENFVKEWQNKTPIIEAIKSILPIGKELYESLMQSGGADKEVLNSGWSKLASCAEAMSRGANDPESEEFQFCREVLLKCARHESPEPDPEYDSKYNHPSWSPAPRNEAAQGLPWLAGRSSDVEILSAIESLVDDRVPSVRFLVTTELFRLSIKDPDMFWHLLEQIAEHEENRVVQTALCHSLSRVVGREESKTTEILDKLLKRILSRDEESEPLESIVTLVMWLALARENRWAIKTADIFLSEPLRLGRSLRHATFEALGYITPEKLDSDDNREAAERAISWLAKAISSAEKGIRELRAIPYEQWNEERRSKLRVTYGVIDEVIMRLYFSADVREDSHHRKEEPTLDDERKHFYFKIKPLLEQVILFALDRDNGLMFAPTAQHFMELLNGVLKYDPKGVIHLAAGVAKSSEPSGYNLDSLAVGQVVKLVEAILADYRSEVRDGEPLEDLLNLLDTFAKTGWPDALRLVWRLDEVFR